ncbi:hypothetical protein O988_07421 [Pseudogymnoascus sp. VKM F-3808]|nr:hypothetical protein O988_07421 [Pseudogymnoascus sp. VKM F-3808]
MSEIQKPVEEVAAVVEAAPAEVVAAPVEEVTPAEVAPVEVAAATEAPAATEEAAVETPKEEFKGEGLIGYKAPGGFIKKLAGFQKRFFWFGSDAVEVKSLSNYLRGEKPEVGNHNAAWSSQTGKGLLYFSKQAGEKSAPVGLINLADITDIKEDGTVEFTFVSHNQKHAFQTANLVDRDNWVAALKEKSAEAKESAETITGSEGYKESHAGLSKPAAVVAPVVAKVEDKKEDKAVAAEETKAEDKKEEAKEETKEEKKARTKSRSASRKRNSIFGGFNLGSKKEEVADKAEAKEEPVVEAPVVEEAAVAEEAAAPAEAPAAEAAVVEEAAVPETRPAASKRHSSLFDFKSRFGSKKAAEATPVVPAKDDEVVTSTEAPVIPAVEQSEPLATSIASPATVPAETVAAEPAAETTTETKAEKRKSALPFGLGQKKEKAEKATESEGEKAEKPLSPFAKLRQTVKGKTSPKAAEKSTETEATEAETPAATEATTETATEAATEEPVVAAPIQTSTPVVSATA